MGMTVFDKVWEAHELAREGGRSLLYIDRHYVHEVTSPQAFEDLRARGLRVRRPELTVAVMDHNVPTGDRSLPVSDRLSLEQMRLLRRNSREHGIVLLDYYSPLQGIVHVVGPELGLTLPGMTVACGDSHTATHGALGALAFGIGTSEAAHVLATQALWVKRPRTMEIVFEGSPPGGVVAKDMVLGLIRAIGVGGAIGHAVEFRGGVVSELNVEERMTLANMSVEAGARTATMSPDDKVFEYLRGRPFAPPEEELEDLVGAWRGLATDPGASFDRSLAFDVSKLEPMVTWGTNPSMAVGIGERIPSPSEVRDEGLRRAYERALAYMGLSPGASLEGLRVDRVFIGSCTNARITDLIDAARAVAGRKVDPRVRAMVVPGSQGVKRLAERTGLHRIFVEAGFEWRNSGCSLCIGMNEDRLSPGERCASTSNRNFENRQGPGGRTHLVSPLTAAAAAVEGAFVDVRKYDLAPVDEVLNLDELEAAGYGWAARRWF